MGSYDTSAALTLSNRAEREREREGEREEFLGGVDSSLFCEIEVE